MRVTKDYAATLSAINTALTFQHQASSNLAQAAAVQNTWYTVLDTTLHCRLISAELDMSTLAENLECRITIDGITLLAQITPATAGAPYFIVTNVTSYPTTLNTTATDPINREFLLEGRSIKVEARKTSANGANTLNSHVWKAVR